MTYGAKLLFCLALSIYFFHQDIYNIRRTRTDFDVSGSALGVSILFFLLQLAAIFCFAVFLLVEAFRIKKVIEVRLQLVGQVK